MNRRQRPGNVRRAVAAGSPPGQRPDKRDTHGAHDARQARLVTAAALRAYDEALLRKSFEVARRSRAAGDHPFGSVLADADGNLLMEQANGYSSEGNDRTAHAERLLSSRAARAYDLKFLARCTLY